MSLTTAVICEEEAAKSQLLAQDTLKLREQENQDTLRLREQETQDTLGLREQGTQDTLRLREQGAQATLGLRVQGATDTPVFTTLINPAVTMTDLLAGMGSRRFADDDVSLSVVNSIDSRRPSQKDEADVTSYEMRDLVVELIREASDPLHDRVTTLQRNLDQVYGLVCEAEHVLEQKVFEITSNYTAEIKKLSVQCAQAITGINNHIGVQEGLTGSVGIKKEVSVLETSVKNIVYRMDMNTELLAGLRVTVKHQQEQIRTLTEVVQVQGLQLKEVIARLPLVEQGGPAVEKKQGVTDGSVMKPSENNSSTSSVADSVIAATTSKVVPGSMTGVVAAVHSEDSAATLAAKKRLTTAAVHTHFSGTGGDAKRDASELVYSFIMTVQEAVADQDQMSILSSQVLMAFMVPDSPGQSWLRLYQTAHRSSLKITLQELYKRFSQATETLTDRFQACKRDVDGGENFQDYHDRLVNLATQMEFVSKAYPDQGVLKPNQLKQFRSGVRDAQATVAIMHCTTLEEAKQALIALTNARMLAGDPMGVPKVVIDLTAITNVRGRQPSPAREQKDPVQQQNQVPLQQQNNNLQPQQNQFPTYQGYQNQGNGYDYQENPFPAQDNLGNYRSTGNYRGMGNYRGKPENYRGNSGNRGGYGNYQNHQNNEQKQNPQQKADDKTSSTGTGQEFNFPCYTCGVVGHKARDCTNRGGGNRGRGRGGGQNGGGGGQNGGSGAAVSAEAAAQPENQKGAQK